MTTQDRSAPPYPGPSSFEAADQAFFFGRARESRELRDLILAYSVVVLYAQSGAGKTSIVNAGVRPLMPADGFPDERIFVARVTGLAAEGGGGEGNIYARHLAHALFPERTGLPATVDSLYQQMRALAETQTLLIIDQAEELFTEYPHRWQDRAPFIQLLGRLAREAPGLRLLISIREDYVAELDSYAGLVPHGFSIRYRLERLRAAVPPGTAIRDPDTGEASPALDAIVKPALMRGVTFAPGVAEAIVRNLATVPVETPAGTMEVQGEFVEPVHLQIVCRNIWERRTQSGPITQEEVHSLGDVNQALIWWYETAVEKARRAAIHELGVRGPWKFWNYWITERWLRHWVSRRLITKLGTRSIVHQQGEFTARLPNASVRLLEQLRVVRQLPRANARWYELTHDRFIPAIRQSNRVFGARQLSRRGRAAILVLSMAMAAGWLFWLEPTAGRARLEADALRSARSGYERVRHGANHRQALLEHVARGNAPPSAIRGLVGSKQRDQLRNYLRAVNQGRGSGTAAAPARSRGNSGIGGAISALERQSAWAQLQLAPAQAASSTGRMAMGWMLALAAALITARFVRMRLTAAVLDARQSSMPAFLLRKALPGWWGAPPRVAHAGRPLRDATGWKLQDRLPPWPTLLLILGLYLITARVVVLWITVAPIEGLDFVLVSITLFVLALWLVQWLLPASLVSDDGSATEPTHPWTQVLLATVATALPLVLTVARPEASGNRGLALLAVLGAGTALAIFAIRWRTADRDLDVLDRPARREFLSALGGVPLALVLFAPIGGPRTLSDGSPVAPLQPRFRKKKGGDVRKTDLASGFYRNPKSAVVHYVDADGVVRCASWREQPKLEPVAQPESSKRGGGRGKGSLNAGCWSVALELYALSALAKNSVDGTLDLLEREIRAKGAFDGSAAGELPFQQNLAIRESALASLVRICDLYAAICAAHGRQSRLTALASMIERHPVLRARASFTMRAARWKDRNSSWHVKRPAGMLRWSLPRPAARQRS